MEPGGGLASSADQHLLQASRNVSVASTTFTTRGAERLWGALMDCKRLFPLCLLGSSPIPSGSEPHSAACAGTEAVGTRQGSSACTSWHQHLGPAAPWAAPALASRWILAVSQPALSVQMIKRFSPPLAWISCHVLGTSCIFSCVCLCDDEPKAVSEAAQEVAEKQKSPRPSGLAEAAIEPDGDTAGRRVNQISLSLLSMRIRESMLPVQGRTPPSLLDPAVEGMDAGIASQA